MIIKDYANYILMIKATKRLCKRSSCIRSMPVLQICKESKLKSGKWFGTSVFNLEQK